VNKSAFQTGVAEGMGWSNGKFGLVPSGSARRRLAAKSSDGGEAHTSTEDDSEEDFEELLDTLATTGIAFSVIFALRIWILFHWSRRANKQYYNHSRRVSDSRFRLQLRKSRHVRRKERPVKFKPLPASFVFPNFEFLVVGLFSIGLVESSVAALASPVCGRSCSLLTTVILIVLGALTLLALVLVLRFHALFSRSSWSRNVLEKGAVVEDPIMRLVSKIRRCCGASPLDRSTGGYEKSEEDASEPARTERLLASPWSLFHANAGDAYDAVSLFWLMRSTSGSLLATCYDFVCYVVMLVLAVAYGLEDLAQRNGPDAQLAQAITVVSLQFGLALYIFVLRPSIDRLENVQNWLQMACEGTATILLLVPVFFPSVGQESTAFTAFIGTLVAVLIPILTKVYDMIVVPIVAWYDAGGGLWSLVTTCAGFIWAIPGSILSYFGVDGAEDLTDTLASEASGFAPSVDAVDIDTDVGVDALSMSATAGAATLSAAVASKSAKASGSDTGNHMLNERVGTCTHTASGASDSGAATVAFLWVQKVIGDSETAETAETLAATKIQRLARGHLMRSRRSYMHTIIHTQDSYAQESSLFTRRCVANQWQETAVRARSVGAMGSSTQNNCTVAAQVLQHWSSEMSEKVKLRVPTRRRVRMPAAPPRPSFSREVTVISMNPTTELEASVRSWPHQLGASRDEAIEEC